MSEDVREARLRRALKRRGLELERSRRRDTGAVDYGRYRIVDGLTKAVVVGGGRFGYEMTLDEVEAWIATPNNRGRRA